MHTRLRTDEDTDRLQEHSNQPFVAAAVACDCCDRMVVVLGDHRNNPLLLLDHRDTAVPPGSGMDSTVCSH